MRSTPAIPEKRDERFEVYRVNERGVGRAAGRLHAVGVSGVVYG